MKYFGEVELDSIKEAIEIKPDALDVYNGKKRLKVEAKSWDNGDISLTVYNDGKRVVVGRLKVSNYQDGFNKEDVQPSTDLPF